jgi:phosphoadenosine phosphosulfate reductase
VDTGKAYPETQELVDFVASQLPLHVVKTDQATQNATRGIPSDVVPINWTVLGQQVSGQKPVTIQSYLQCCWENISAPLLAKAKELGVTKLVYGQRNDEAFTSPSRNGAMVDGIERVQPLEEWTREDVLSYLSTKMDLPAHFQLTHSSLDCYDCTAFEQESQDRLEWTAKHHPEFYAHYHTRRTAIDSALREALLCQVM